MNAKVIIPIIFSTMLLCGSAHADDNPPKEPKKESDILLTEILADTMDIKAATDNLPVDPASQSAVEDAMFTDVEVVRFKSADTSGRPIGIECTPDRDIIVHVSMHIQSGNGRKTLEVRTLFAGGGGNSNFFPITETTGLTFGAEAGDTLKLEAQATDQQDGLFAIATFQTTDGTEMNCFNLF